MCAYYVYREERDAGSYLIGLFLFLIVAAFLVVGLLYVGAIALAIFLGVGALIGFVYAVITYVREFVNALKSVGSITGRNRFTTFLLRWWYLFKTTALNSLKSNLCIAHNEIIRAHNYRFISFRRWMWLIVAPAVLIFGTVMILFVLFLKFSFLLGVSGIVFSVLLLIFGVYFAIALGYAAFKCVKGASAAIVRDNPLKTLNFSKYFLFIDFKKFPKNYFSALIKVVLNVWNLSLALIRTNISLGTGYPKFSLKKYFLFVTPVAIMPITLLLIALIFIVVSIAFIPIFIVKFSWTIIASIIRK